MTYLVDDKSHRIDLDQLLADGKGGEGAVFAVQGTHDLVVKIYHTPPDAEKVEKLRYMCDRLTPPLEKVTAWPCRLVFDPRSRRAVGFAMPRADGKPVWQLFQPVERAKSFPFAGWDFQARSAANLAAAVEEVHTAGCVIGDFNLRNVFVSKAALVRLIDCDSYQIRTPNRHYLCDIGMPEYTPPELQGNAPRGTGRTRNHDNFALAVLIYQLLFLGKHPYSGKYLGPNDPSLNESIRDYLFCQGPRAHQWKMAPPVFSPTFDDIPPDLGGLFCRAFERGSQHDSRPEASDWVRTLRQLEPQIVECGQDPSHRIWRGQKSCVWCRIEAQVRVPFYFGVGGTAGTFEVDEERLQDVLRRLAAVPLVLFPAVDHLTVKVEEVIPRPLPRDLDEHNQFMVVLAVATAACVLMMPFGLVRGFLFVIGLLAAVVFGTWLGVLYARSPLRRERRRRRRAYDLARRAQADLENDWDRAVYRYRRDHAAVTKAVRRLVEDCYRLAADYQRELSRLSASAEAIARDRHLRLCMLADATIRNIGAGRKQALAAHGVYSAYDVEWNRISRISGFGDALTRSVIAWRDEKLREFRFDPKTAVSPADQRALVLQFRAEQNRLLAKIDREIADLHTLAPACRATLEKLKPKLRRAAAEWEQAAADLRVLRRR